MTTQRLSAKDAIAALKAYQLQTVNAGILNEISAIKGNLTDWKLQLDEARRDVQIVTDKIHGVPEAIRKHTKTLSQLETGHKEHEKEFEGLRASQIALEEKVSKTVSALDVRQLQHETLISKLRQDLVQLGDKIRQLEEWEIQITDELRRDIAEKGGTVNIEELEDKLDNFIQDARKRFQELQKSSNSSDTFANLHAHREVGSQPADDASALTDSSQPTNSPRQDSNADRWRPIDVQTAFGATPPPQPETVPFIHREDSDAQTPSTFRSAKDCREDVSNIYHVSCAEPVDQSLAHKEKPFQDEHIDVLEQQAGLQGCRKDEQVNDWHTLTLLLELRQGQGETLTHYLARLQDVVVRLGPGQDVIAACLRRLICGVADPRSKSFMQDWLMTSEWTLENVQDCILLLTKCCGRQRTIGAVTKPIAQTNERILIDRCHVDDGFDIGNAAHPVTVNDFQAKDPSENIQNVPKVLARKRSRPKQRSQPARAVKARKVEILETSRGQCREKTDEVSHIIGADSQQPQEEVSASTQQNVFHQVTSKPAADVHPEAVVAEHVTRKRKRSSKRAVCARELKSLLDTKTIEKAVPPPLSPTASLKRKTLHQPEKSKLPAAPNEYSEPPEPPANREQSHLRRTPKLVPRRTGRAASIAETVGALDLPPIPGGLDGQTEEGNISHVEDMARKRTRKACADLPVLSLSASDFQS